MSEKVSWLVGVDWASQEHQVCILDTNGKCVGERVFPHGGEGLTALCAWLLATTGAEPGAIAVAIEVPHGPVVEALLEREFQAYSINPKQLDRFRDRFSIAGAKDDRRDGHVLADSLRTDRPAFRRLAMDDPVMVELREWSRMTDDLQRERNRLANRVRDQLWRYYPQMLELTSDLWADWFLELWRLVPTPSKAKRVRKTSIEAVLKAHRIRRLKTADVLAVLTTKPLFVAPGVEAATTAHIRMLAVRINLVNQQLKAAHHQLDTLSAKLEAPSEKSEPEQRCKQRDVEILRSMPGNGRIVSTTLLTEAWEPLQRRDYHAIRTLSGVAPVTRQSGKHRIVMRRYACNRRLANAMFHWARVASQVDPGCRARYVELRQRGHRHGRALRTIGDRLLKVACTLLERQTLFDPAYPTHQAAEVG
jgi:transposase